MKFHQKEVKQQRGKCVAAALAVCSKLEMHFSGSSMDPARLGVLALQSTQIRHLFTLPALGIGLQSFALTSAVFSQRWDGAGPCVDAFLGSGFAREGPIPSAPLPQFSPGGALAEFPKAQAGGFAPNLPLKAVTLTRLWHWRARGVKSLQWGAHTGGWMLRDAATLQQLLVFAAAKVFQSGDLPGVSCAQHLS